MFCNCYGLFYFLLKGYFKKKEREKLKKEAEKESEKNHAHSPWISGHSRRGYHLVVTVTGALNRRGAEPARQGVTASDRYVAVGLSGDTVSGHGYLSQTCTVSRGTER